MHELSIAFQLVDQIVEIAQANQWPRVDEVELEAGVLRLVVPEVMHSAFKEATHHTLADGAVLTLNEVMAKARCQKCGLEFEPEIDNFLCPQCHVADVQILQGNEIVLKSVSCQM